MKKHIIRPNLKSDTLNKLYVSSWWLQAASTDVARQESKIILNSIDDVCFRLEKQSENKKILLEKVRQLSWVGSKDYQSISDIDYKNIKELTEQEQEHRRRVWDFINELRTCVWLEQESFSNIEIIPIGKKKTPDIRATKDNMTHHIEVKTLHVPRDEEVRLLSYEVEARDVEIGYREGLKNKVISFIKDAENKFDVSGSQNKILVIHYSLSISATITNAPDERNLEDILGGDFFSDLEKDKKINIVIINQKQ